MIKFIKSLLVKKAEVKEQPYHALDSDILIYRTDKPHQVVMAVNEEAFLEVIVVSKSDMSKQLAKFQTVKADES